MLVCRNNCTPCLQAAGREHTHLSSALSLEMCHQLAGCPTHAEAAPRSRQSRLLNAALIPLQIVVLYSIANLEHDCSTPVRGPGGKKGGGRVPAVCCRPLLQHLFFFFLAPLPEGHLEALRGSGRGEPQQPCLPPSSLHLQPSSSFTACP